MSDPVLVVIPERTEDQIVAEASEALVNYKKLVVRVGDVFGDGIKASVWLSSPSKDLGGETPIKVAQKYGYSPQVLEPILTRIEHGIY